MAAANAITIRPGDQFGYLSVVKNITGQKWECRCICGTVRPFWRCQLLNGQKSCGCNHDLGSTTHGMYRTTEYRSWYAMKNRCYWKADDCYADYGGRGITVCDRWRDSFQNFYADMGPKPSAKHSLDRKEVNGDYCPENCRWATPSEQQCNRRDSVRYTHDGFTGTKIEWVRHLGVNPHTFRWRVRNGNTVMQAIEFYSKKLSTSDSQ